MTDTLSSRNVTGYLTPNSIDPQTFLRVLVVSKTIELIAAVNGQLSELGAPRNWQQFGTMTPEEIADYFFGVWLEYIGMSLVGVILPYATQSCPTFALPCDGASYARVDYPALYAAIDSVFHVDADNFVVPDLRFAIPLAPSGGHIVGEVGGEEDHTLDTTEMPAHSHTDTGHTHTENIALPAVGAALVGVPIPSAMPSVGLTGIGYAGISSAGGGGAHNNLQPYVVIGGWCIVSA